MEITVSGSSEASVPPQLATVTVQIEAEHRNPRAAFESVQDRTNRLLGELDEQQSTAIESVHTDGVSTFAIRGDRRPEHLATCRIHISFNDPTALAEHTARWSAEGMQVSAPRWDLTPEQRADTRAQCLRAALDDAQQRARVIADHLGGSEPVVTRVTDTFDDAAPYQTRMMPLGARAAESEPVVARPDDVTVRATVTVVYECEAR